MSMCGIGSPAKRLGGRVMLLDGGELREQGCHVAPIDGGMAVGVQCAVRVELSGEVGHSYRRRVRPVAPEQHVPRLRERQQTRQRRGAGGERGVKVETAEVFEYLPSRSSGLRQFGLDRLELLQRSTQIFRDLGSDDVGIGEILGAFEAVVLEPEDVEAEFVPLE